LLEGLMAELQWGCHARNAPEAGEQACFDALGAGLGRDVTLFRGRLAT
jgi:hypothetical protein